MNKYGRQRRELTRDIIDRCGAPLRVQKAQMDAEIRTLLRPVQRGQYDLLIRDSNLHGPVGDAGVLEPLP